MAIFLGDLKSSFIVLVAVLMIDIGKKSKKISISSNIKIYTDLLGVMFFWNIQLNNVSLLNLLICVGLAVDACAHIAHAFIIRWNNNEDINEAIIGAMSTM